MCVRLQPPHASTAAAQDRVSLARCHAPAPSTRAQEACTNKTRMPRNTSWLPCRSHQKSRNIPQPRYGPHPQVSLPDTLGFQAEAAAPRRWQVYSHRQPSKTHGHTRHMCACACVEERSTTHAKALRMPDRTTHSPHPHYKGAPMHRINMTGTTIPHEAQPALRESHRDTAAADSPHFKCLLHASPYATCGATSHTRGRQITHSARPRDFRPGPFFLLGAIPSTGSTAASTARLKPRAPAGACPA